MKAAIVSALAVYALAGESSLEIYQNKAFLHQNLINPKSKIAVEVPSSVNKNDIEVSASCELIGLELNPSKIIEDDKYLQNQTHEKRLKELENRLGALDEKLKFLTSQNLIKEINIDSLKLNGDKFYDVVFENLNEISAVKAEIEKLKTAAEPFAPKSGRKLELNFECEPKFVKISYPVYLNMRLQSQILADTTKGKIDVKQNLIITNPLNSDINNLDVFIYPFAYSSNLAPNVFSPRYEGSYERVGKEFSASMQKTAMIAPAPEANEMRSARKMIAAQGENFQSPLANVWKISGVTLKSGEENSLTYDKQELDAKFELVIDGYGTQNAYIKAKFKPQRSIEGTYAALKIDGVNIGKSYFLAQPNEEKELFLGKNGLVSVKKERVDNFTSESFFGGSQKLLNTFAYEIKNSSNRDWSVTLLEQVPVSTHEDVKVAVKNTPKEDEISKQGEVSWKFELKPNESKKIEFSYELTKPK